MANVVCWRDKNNQPQGCWNDEWGPPEFRDAFKLRSKKDLYLLVGSRWIYVVDFSTDNAGLNYPAFSREKHNYRFYRFYDDCYGLYPNNKNYSSFLTIDPRCFYVLFDEKTQKLTLYDNMRGYSADGNNAVLAVLKFNGKEFVTIFEYNEE